MRARLLSLLCVLVVAATAAAALPVAPDAKGPARPLPDPGGRIAAAVTDAADGLEWLAFDAHLHTDYSADAGLPHQQEKAPENHDTFLDEQRDQAIRLGMDAVAFTDHRTFDQHYSPDYATDDAILLTGEEWGGGRHGTAFGIVEVLEHGPTTRTGCGVAEMTLEAAAQDALFGIAHPKDNMVPCVDLPSFVRYPMSHIEALRGGDGALQTAGFPSNGSNVEYYVRLLQAGGRVAAVNGSDNHFKQLWATPAGPGLATTYALVRDRTEAGLREALHARRTIAGLDVTKPRVLTLLDADRDGTFDAVTGGWAEPTGETVTVAVRVEQGTGHHVQLFDDADALVAEELVGLPDQTFAFQLPAASAYYRAAVVSVPQVRVGLPDPLDYADTLVVVSTPVWTTAPENHAEAVRLGDAAVTALAPGADWSGFPAVARSGATIHAVWQERHGTVYGIGYARSADGGATWTPARTIAGGGNARHPAVAVDGDRVVVAWEEHDDGRLGGDVLVTVSGDGGATFGAAAPAGSPGSHGTRPVVVASAGVDHLAWTGQDAEGTWAVWYRRLQGGAMAGPPVRVSTAAPWACCTTSVATPPRTIMHVPASVNPALAVRGDTVVLAWEDNRDDPTPLRNGTPDDWGIWTATSADGGLTWSQDVRATPRRLRRDDPTPEGVEGNPARQAAVAITDDGTVLLAYSDPFGSGAANVWVQRREAGGDWADPVPVAPPSAEWAYRPRLVVGDGAVQVVWQASDDPHWHLASARSTDGGRTFTPAELLTSGRYAGWPAPAGDVVVFTAESPAGFGVHASSGR
jgi:hypothetical protein